MVLLREVILLFETGEASETVTVACNIKKIMRGSVKDWKKLINTVGVEQMKRLESDEFYEGLDKRTV